MKQDGTGFHTATDPRTNANLATEDIAMAIVPARTRKPLAGEELRDHIRAAVFPLALRCEELAVEVAKLRGRLRDARRSARQELDAILVDWVDGR